MSDDGLQRVVDRAIALLSYRSRSARDLEAKLVEKGEDPQLAALAIARLAELGLLDDRRFAESRTRSQVAGARSVRRMQRDLTQKGVDASTAREAVAQVLRDEGRTERDLARQAAQKKLRSLDREGDPRVRRQKLLAFLARQGFSADASMAAVRALDAKPGPDDDALDEDPSPDER